MRKSVISLLFFCIPGIFSYAQYVDWGIPIYGYTSQPAYEISGMDIVHKDTIPVSGCLIKKILKDDTLFLTGWMRIGLYRIDTMPVIGYLFPFSSSPYVQKGDTLSVGGSMSPIQQENIPTIFQEFAENRPLADSIFLFGRMYSGTLKRRSYSTRYYHVRNQDTVSVYLVYEIKNKVDTMVFDGKFVRFSKRRWISVDDSDGGYRICRFRKTKPSAWFTGHNGELFHGEREVKAVGGYSSFSLSENTMGIQRFYLIFYHYKRVDINDLNKRQRKIHEKALRFLNQYKEENHE